MQYGAEVSTAQTVQSSVSEIIFAFPTLIYILGGLSHSERFYNECVEAVVETSLLQARLPCYSVFFGSCCSTLLQNVMK